MHGGRIVTDASPAELKSRLAEEAGLLLELSTEDPLPAIKLLEAEGFAGIALFGKKIRLLASAPSEAKKRISSVLKREGIGLLGIREQPLSMEDVFVYRILSLERERGAGS
jgi:ABC-2 type transport system ATP-binding protein